MVLEVRADDFDGLKLPKAISAKALRCPAFIGLGHFNASDSREANGASISSSESENGGGKGVALMLNCLSNCSSASFCDVIRGGASQSESSGSSESGGGKGSILRGWRKKARECKHSIEQVRTGDTAAVHMTRWKAIWMTHGNGVQFNAAVLIMVGTMRADERGCGNGRGG